MSNILNSSAQRQLTRRQHERLWEFGKFRYNLSELKKDSRILSRLKYDKDGNLYSELDKRITSFPRCAEVVQCQNCGYFTLSGHDKLCPVCGRPVITVQHRLFVDPVEYAQEYQEIKNDLHVLIAKEFPPRERKFGYCHGIWEREQQILLEYYHIRWRTPAEMNPGVIFD